MINNKYPTTKPSLNLDFANTKSLDPRITFRRGTPGTYYDGVTHVKAEENLLSYSENFNDVDNYWAEVRATLTGSQASPIDSTSAYELSQTSTGLAGVLLVNENKIKLQIGKQYVSSVYVKASSSNYFAIAEEVSLGTGTPAFTYFDLSNDGEVMLNHENHIASIQNVGNQWYRCSIMFTAKLESDYTVMFYLDGGSSQSTISEPQNVTAGASIYLWGAQLEQRDAVTSYTATNGTPITKYQPKLMTAAADQARFDHDPITGESKGLLIEEQRTNLVQESEDVSGVRWSEVVNFELNAICAPDGTISADRIYQTDAINSQSRNAGIDLVDGVDYVYSVYAKNHNLGYLRINIAGGSGIRYNLIDGSVTVDGNPSSVVSAFSGDIEFVGNGWYRCIYKFTSSYTGATTARNVVIDVNGEVQGDGKSGVYIWGAQFEQATFPTSYIKTTGASATRSADNASITGENFSSWYRQDEGSIYCESYSYNDYVQRILNISDSSSNNRIVLTAFNSEQLLVKNNANTEISIDAGSYTVGEFLKQGTAYKDDSFFVTLGGNSGSSIDRTNSTSDGSVPKSLNKLNIGSSEVNNFYLNGHIKKLAYYPQRLTNEQLQNLTK